jgi:hypothetical protein
MFISAMWFLAMAILIMVTSPALQSVGWRVRQWPSARRRQRTEGQSWPITRVVDAINPIVRGWVNYFAIGHSSRCFGFVRSWIEKKIRRHLMRARKRRGYGWERWTSQWPYGTMGLCNGYRLRTNLRYASPKTRSHNPRHEANR